MKISLWLLPPEPIRLSLQGNIDAIASRASLPTFVPHVTILGGIVCPADTKTSSDQWADDLLAELRLTLTCVEGIPCRFRHEGPIAAKEEGGSIKWNQSCISVMERNDRFRRAIELTHDAVCKVNDRMEGSLDSDGVNDGDAFDWRTALKPPICEPHYSHAYGSDAGLLHVKIGNDDDSPLLVQTPPDFVSQEAMLIWTYPPSVDGVSNWKEVGRCKLFS